MARFVAISGPSSSGKTSLFDELRNRPELSKAIFLSDIFADTWYDLVDRGLFSEYEEVNKDSEFLCVFIQKVLDLYNDRLSCYGECPEDTLIIMDSCWLDVSVYSIINMWYTHVIKEVQENILKKLSIHDDYISRIYITAHDESKFRRDKYRVPFKRYNIKYNRPLELQYYNLASHMKEAQLLESSDTITSASSVIEDLRELGYI